MSEWNDISKTARILSFHELFIKYSTLFTWYRMLLNLEVRTYEHNRIDHLVAIFLLGLFLGILLSLLSDYYLGKYNTLYFCILIGILQPFFCTMTYLPSDMNRSQDYWLLSSYQVNLLEVATVLCKVFEGTRMALVFEQMSIPKKQFTVRKFIAFLFLMQRSAQLLLNLTLLLVFYYPNIYGLFSFMSAFFYGLYMNRIILDRQWIKEDQTVKGYVFQTLACAAVALAKGVKNTFSLKNVPLYSNEDYVVIRGAKKVLDLVVIGLTVTALSISFHLLYQYMYLYTKLFAKSEFDYAISTVLRAMFDIFSILTLIILEFVIIPMFERNNLCKSNLQCLKATFVILGAALVWILAIDCYNNYENGIGSLTGGCELRIYNGAVKAVTIKHKNFIKKIMPMELLVFKTFPNEKTYITIRGEGLNKPYWLTTTLYQAETYIVTGKELKKIKTLDPIFKVTPSYEVRPHVNCMVVSNEESFSGNLTVNDNVIEMKGDEGFFSASTGIVNISINGSKISKTPAVLEIGRSYVIFLYLINGSLVNITLDPLDRHYQTSVFWISFPFVLTILGRCLGDVSTFCFLYKESPPNLRSIMFSYFIICYDFGLINQLLNNNIIVKSHSINIALTLCSHVLFFIILCAISKNYNFRLAHWL